MNIVWVFMSLFEFISLTAIRALKRSACEGAAHKRRSAVALSPHGNKFPLVQLRLHNYL